MTDQERIITVVACPYERRASVKVGSHWWDEIITRGAFDNATQNPTRVRVNRGHDNARTIGKVIALRSRTDGLVADVFVAKTPLGDETLALAEADCLSASVGYADIPEWIVFDHEARLRRVNRAVLRHLSLVEEPAFTGAKVLAVRGQAITPNLDAMIADPVFAGMRDELLRCRTRAQTAASGSNVDSRRQRPALPDIVGHKVGCMCEPCAMWRWGW